MIRAASMFLFWMVAAILVVTMPAALGLTAPVAVVVVKIAIVVAVAGAYVTVSRHPASIEGALIAGAAWLLLDVIAELVVGARTGRSWFELIGSPAAPVLRTCLLFAWVTAPALFVRGHNAATPT
jgi:hypothetical protein